MKKLMIVVAVVITAMMFSAKSPMVKAGNDPAACKRHCDKDRTECEHSCTGSPRASCREDCKHEYDQCKKVCDL